MREKLRQLYVEAGSPPKGALKAHADRGGYTVGESTLIAVPTNSAKGLSRTTVDAFVKACLSYARSNGRQLSPQLTDMAGWQALYDRTRPRRRTADSEWEAVRGEYQARLRERYGGIDIEGLVPLVDQGDHPIVRLREVFVAQAVRADPPAVELPRELWQRLADMGDVGLDELPEVIDRNALARIQQTYHQRPARPVLEVIAEATAQKLVILGVPGAGKSTLARYLALTLANGGGADDLTGLAGWLPLLVELRTYAEPRWRNGTFFDLLNHLHCTDGLGLPEPLLESFLRSDGRAVVIFDGLDELFDPKLREDVTHQITGFAARYPRARIVVTSRVIGYRRQGFDAAGFTHHMLQDLDRGQVAAFAKRWYRIACAGNLAEAERLRTRLLDAIDDSRAVRELAGNPMLLTILSIIGRRRELPRDRRTVYDHAVTVLVEHWEVNKHLHNAGIDPNLPRLDRDDKLELLRLVARRMQDAPAGLSGNHIPGTDLIDEFDKYLRTRYELPPGRARYAARAMLDQFRERNFVLSRFGAEVYGFVHRAFLEYLAAADIVDRFDNRDLSEDDLITGVFGRRWADPAWHEVLLLVAGMKERFAGKIIASLLSLDPLWYLRPGDLPHHALLAIRCLGEVRKLGTMTAQSNAIADTVINLLETAHGRETHLGGTDLAAAIRQIVVPVFTVLGQQWAGRHRYHNWYLLRGQHLRTSVYASSEPIMSLATRLAVALTPNDTFRIVLQTQATLGHTSEMRESAVEALAAGWPEDPGTLPLLRDRATADLSGAVRRAAVQALATGWPEDPATFPLMRDRATTDLHPYVRHVAVQALAAGWPEDPGTLPLLRDRATIDLHPHVRHAAVQALATGWPEDPATFPLLQDLATADPDEQVRRAAVEALAAGWREDPATLPWLRVCAATGMFWDVRQAAVEALAAGWREDPGTLLLLRDRATTDQFRAVRRAAVLALATGWPEDPGTLPLLYGCAATDRSGVVRGAALEAVATGWPEDPDVLPRLRERATADSNERVRRVALQVLATGWPEDPGTLPLLHHLAATDQSGAVRRAAVQTLAAGWREDPGTLPWLRECATTDQPGQVRQAALEAVAIGWREDPGTLPWLRECATTDQPGQVRQTAVQAVAAGWREDAATLPLLHDRATIDPDEQVRRAAVQTLAAGWREDPGTLPWLRECATTDQSEQGRQAALEALAAGWPEDPGTLPLLHDRATTDQFGAVRRAAVQALATGWPEDPAILPWLRERATTDPDQRVRRVALQALATGWREDPATLPLLHDRATTDQFGDVRQSAVQILVASWRGDPATLALLRDRAITDQFGPVRQAAMQALAAGWHEDPAILPWLRERATTDPSERVRRVALRVLATGRPEDPATLPLLRDRATTDPNQRVRRVALHVLATGWPEDPATLPLLRHLAATDPSERVRRVAAHALATARRKTAVSSSAPHLSSSPTSTGWMGRRRR